MPDRIDASASAEDYILLFGMPRSGTTWIGKLFDSHPDVLYRHEPDTWRPLSFSRYPGLADAQDCCDELRSFVAAMPRMNSVRVAGKKPLFPKSYMSGLRSKSLSAAVELARLGSRVYAEFPVWFHPSTNADRERRIVWKSIESLGRMGVVLALCEDARAIQILRHPCGYIASVKRGLASHRFTYQDSGSDDYGIFTAVENTPLGQRYNLSREYLRSLTNEERMAWRWVLINEKAWDDSQHSGRYLCVHYEDICADPLSGIQSMFSFAGLEMNDQTRSFIGQSTHSDQGSYYSVFKDASRAAWRWREELDAETVERVMAIVGTSRIGARYATMVAPDERVL
ncbi:MAG: sulfotransferase [Salinisphaera sp.]|jgi:hypothetical protein|nr:sulfotransferase [Salinisphaera sp.]